MERPDPDPPQVAPDGGPPPAPRWVKISAAIAVLLILFAIVKHLVDGGMRGHPPGPH